MQAHTTTNFLGDDGLTRPTSNNSLTMHKIFTLKSSDSVYTVQFINTFCHFLNSNVGKFYATMSFPTPTYYGDDDHYFYREIIFRSLPTKAEEQSTFP